MNTVAKAVVVALWLGVTGLQATEPMTVQEVSGQLAEYYARAYSVPVELVDAIIEVESDWHPYAVSRKGAAGLMQLMPSTAVDLGVWNRFHIQENIRGGVAYLAWLIRVFRGDLRLATAAYLVGESSIRSRGLEYSSPEVYSYVSRVAQVYRAKRREAARRTVHVAAARGESGR